MRGWLSESRRAPGAPGRITAAPRLAACVATAACAATVAAAVAAPAAAAVARPAARPGPTAAPPRSIVVATLAGSGRGSLRAAINAANAGPAQRLTIITFSVHGVITLGSALPAIYRWVVIDGRSAPTHHAGGPPVVEVNNNGHAGLRFAVGSGSSQLFGLAVVRASGAGVTINASKITLDKNFIGLNLAGRPAGNRGAGVYASASSARNLIGLNRSGVSGVVGNVISANHGNGIVLAGSSHNTVVANRIGTNRAGTEGLGNRSNGILLTKHAFGNEIGGTRFVNTATGQANNPTGDKGTETPVFVVPPDGNQISGNVGNGVLINDGSRFNALNGNFIGTTRKGNGLLGNLGDGVRINGSGHNSLIGCKFVNNPFVYYNVVSGNRGNGLRVTSSNSTVAQGNFFGIGANNSTAVRNKLDGIRVEGTSQNVQVGGVIPLGNVSAGNGHNGIEVTGKARGFVTFNTFGGLAAFGAAVPNGNDGVLITATGGNNLVRTNVMSGNRRNGIEIAGNASFVTVDPDIAGLNTDGNAVLPNGGDGVLIDQDAHRNTIGGTLRSVIRQNTFSGNLGYGLAIIGNAHDNLVRNTFIGTEILGVTALGNQKGGVLVGGHAHGNLIGKPFSRRSNIISGNKGNGVTLQRGTLANSVLNNFIGLNRFGHSLPNTGQPIVNSGRANVIKGNRT
jgi:parallel beta-helix repeat protein